TWFLPPRLLTMTSNDDGIIRCGTHGEVQRTFVCCHLTQDELAPAGFNEFEPEPDDTDPLAWCDDCIRRYEAAGEEMDAELEAFVDLRVVCEFCYAKLRELHE